MKCQQQSRSKETRTEDEGGEEEDECIQESKESHCETS